ncbi:MAG: ergothioneine biosynthesis protein EgtC [Pseudonocardia sp.]|nr:ergothioneine biosynthesis protein EgtC [Pseudonocardia sp.]
MCRHLAYLGPPVSVASLVLQAPHGLLRQSYAPADMRGGGTINADGFGVGWYPTPDGDAVRYRSAAPIWSDQSFPDLARSACAPAVLAAVRSATTGMPVTVTAAAPFSEGRWLFSHNGVVRGWPESVAGIAARLPVTDLLTLESPTDAALIWALVRHGLRAARDPAEVLATAIGALERAAPGSRLNLLLTDGTTIWATTWAHALSVRDTGTAVTVASEPIDHDPCWQAVPDRHLVVARPGELTIRPLDETGHA